jgi:hypothetical protein
MALAISARALTRASRTALRAPAPSVAAHIPSRSVYLRKHENETEVKNFTMVRAVSRGIL